jgi:hypothetical protein
MTTKKDSIESETYNTSNQKKKFTFVEGKRSMMIHLDQIEHKSKSSNKSKSQSITNHGSEMTSNTPGC